MTTVEKILVAAEMKGVSRAELVDLLNIDLRTLDDWRRGLYDPTIKHIILVSEYFGVTTDYLLKSEIEHPECVG